MAASPCALGVMIADDIVWEGGGPDIIDLTADIPEAFLPMHDEVGASCAA